jgi:nicotinate-nucleotide adenylyltransferase
VSEGAPIRRDDSARLPTVSPGMRVGLFGGSFNPPHEAHRAASLLAWKRLALDRIWWLATPGNPLKDAAGLAPLAKRIERARTVAANPFIEVTGIEARMGTRFTYDTVSRLRSQYPLTRFVLVMGADNLAEFHRWRRWRELSDLVPIAVIDRAGWTFRALASPAASALHAYRIPDYTAAKLASEPPPAWVFLPGLKSPRSSTALRNSNRAEG